MFATVEILRAEGGCLRIACFVYRFAEEGRNAEEPEGWKVSDETRLVGRESSDARGNYNPVRLFFFVQTEKTFESLRGSRYSFPDMLTKSQTVSVLEISLGRVDHSVTDSLTLTVIHPLCQSDTFFL